MPTTAAPSPHAPERRPIGSAGGVALDVVTWGPALADVDLSAACMFEHEADGAAIGGGLLQLDDALGSQLTRLRGSGAFRARPMETLLITLPPAGMVPRALLVIGLGDPATLSAERLARAAGVALREAVRQGARSLAVAPSVLDAGRTDNAALRMPESLLGGLLDALRTEHLLAEAGLAPPPALRHCSFDVGAPRLAAAAGEFAAAFARLAGAVSSPISQFK